MKKLLILLFVIFLVGCTKIDADADPVSHDVDDHEQLIMDLIERIALLEEELGNLKEDLEDGLYE